MMKFLLFLYFFILAGCSTTYPNKNIAGEVFPSVKGTSLNDKKWNLPEDFKGSVVLLLIGYKQNSQFDIDRWLIGLDQTQTKVDILEVPAIQGFFPKLISEKIDEGMRRGIPKEIWKAVVTVYEDGEKIQKFTGNTNPNNTRVALLDRSGVIQYFYDRGFSVDALNQLREKILDLNKKD